MGQIADDMITGTVCQLCGQFFEDSRTPGTCPTHGYPVVCWECWDEMDELPKPERKKLRKAYQRAIYPVLGTGDAE